MPSQSRGATHRPPRCLRRLLLVLLLPLLVLTGCGGDVAGGDPTGGEPAPSGSAAGSAAFPVTVSGAAGEVTLDAAPQKIVSLSPTATEILFAVGAGSQVVAVDDNSTYPPEAPRTKLSGFQPNTEAVAGYAPDLVVLADDTNGVVSGLQALKIPVLLLPAAATLDDSYAQTYTLGRATGHPDEAEKLVQRTQERIAAAVSAVPASARGTKVYHELDPTYYSVTSSTFLGSIYRMLGLTNIADAAKDASGGYPKLSAEFVVKAAPELIVLADAQSGGQTPEKVAARPGFGAIPAVRSGRVVPVDEDIASRWGPRTADFAEAVVKALGNQAG